MDEYKRLYEMYLRKTDAELQDIINPESGYTPFAIKAASDILEFGRIPCEQAIMNQGGTITFPTPETIQTAPTKKVPFWLLILSIISGLIAGAVLMLGISDLRKASELEPENKIQGCYYEGSNTGSGSYYGMIFYFYDKNTFRYTTNSADRIGYGTYNIDGNALTLNASTDIYETVIIDNGNKIMIDETELDKVTDSKTLLSYKKIFEESE